MITKGRLHIAYAILRFMSIAEVCVCFLFLRKDLSRKQVCTTVNIVTTAGIYAVLMLNCALLATVMVVSFIWIMVQLKKRKRNINNRIPNNSNSKLNRPILTSLGIYICLYVPIVIIVFTFHVHGVPHMLFVLDMWMLLFYMTTLINPFIYYVTMKDFRQGNKHILLCKTIKENRNQQIELAVIEC